jgi:AmmeMemoRadiSam system protein A
MTSDADRRTLLEFARQAIDAHVNGRPAPPVPDCPAAAMPGGAFVTIHKGGQLRGCIGHIEADLPRGQVIARCAIQSCSADPRFPAVTAGEVPHLTLELSLLGPLERISGVDEIDIGRHGLVVEEGWRRGLLLPQVASERGWDAQTFVTQTCRKAGLSPDAVARGAALWRFDAEVFGD